MIREADGKNVMELDQKQIMEIIPHRPPMLLVDRVLELVPGERCVSTFYVDPTREIFKGHFPGDPVLPGVYTVEATAQTADILLLSLDRYRGKTPLFLGIDRVTFLQKIIPGDTIEMRVSIVKERKEKAIATCAAEVFCGGKLTARSEVTLAMR
jgi:3-hydroxyacyl-[acyl-carrier-protein] dehydratase